MHQLDRAAHPEPECLKNYQPGRHDWNHDVSASDRKTLRDELLKMTRERCAYCEKLLRPPVDASSPEEKEWHKVCHIEHFRRRSANPGLTFTWSNLFLSCNSQTTCGKHKDESAEVRERPFDPDHIIKPDNEDPERLLFFAESGEVRPQRGLTPADAHRALETIRAFNLNHPTLRDRRRRAAGTYRDTKLDFFELLQAFTADDTAELLREEIARTADDEFATTIRHLLQPSP